MEKTTLIRLFDSETTPYAPIPGSDRTSDDFAGHVPSVGDIWADKRLGAYRNTIEVIARYFDPSGWDAGPSEDGTCLVRLVVRRRDPLPREIDILGF
jgi:hypothetical protein